MDQGLQYLISLGFAVLLIIIGYIVGSVNEKKHYESIKIREKLYLKLPAVTLKNSIPEGVEVENSALVVGGVVVALDQFKKFLAGLYNIFGGEVRSFETLVDRARREAILRMKENAGDAYIIQNMRIETSTIGSTGKRDNSAGAVEVIAYGTAVYIKK